MTNDILRLPAYPSSQSRKSLSASQRAALNQSIASTLGTVLALPPQKRDTQSTRDFLTTYARDTAFQVLQNAIWRNEGKDEGTDTALTKDERLVQRRALMLAEKLAQTAPGLNMQTLLDLAIIYARTHPAQLQLVFKAAAESSSSSSSSGNTSTSLPHLIATDLIPSLTSLLSQQTSASHGLYAQRKIAECILSFLLGAKGTAELIRPFAHNKPFLIALASLYDAGLTSIAASYGGLPALSAGIAGDGREADEWETIWVETKVALLDAFHIVLRQLIEDLAECPPGPRLAAEAERTFDVVFALLDVPSSSASTGELTPFLNQSLLADYQQSYSLSKTLASALKHAEEKDARLDLLEASLQSLESSEPNTSPNGAKKAGALKIILRSSGIQPGIDNFGTRTARARDAAPTPPSLPTMIINKGKSRAPTQPTSEDDPDLDLKTTQVLDVLPDTPVPYIRRLLAHDRYGRDPEKVVGALLEGTALTEEELERALGDGKGEDLEALVETVERKEYSVAQRRNVWDDEDLDISKLRVGKKAAGDEVLRDRTFIEEMKADILRRAEAISDDEDEEVVDGSDLNITTTTKIGNKGKGRDTGGPPRAADIGPDEDEDDLVHLKVAVDGEDSGDSGDEDEEHEEEDGDGKDKDEEQTPETILELAYLRDPKLFDRDAATRRSKAREELKKRTGWDDPQIEGWKIMLERNPKQKERIAEKHAFRGNEKGLDLSAVGGGSGGGRGRGRGRGGPRGGRGRGGGGGGGRGGGARGGDSSARERARKDRRGNQARTRGHDKKMARAGAVPGPST